MHELVNHMLNKKSNLTYETIRDRYENFRSRCTPKNIKNRTWSKRHLEKHSGCVTPKYKKCKCILEIVPITTRKPTMTLKLRR